MSDTIFRELMLRTKGEIEAKRPMDLSSQYVAFSGLPGGASRETGMVVLLPDPLSGGEDIHEFRTADIGYIEEIDTLALDNGTTAVKVRVWVRRGSPAVSRKQFIVGQ